MALGEFDEFHKVAVLAFVEQEKTMHPGDAQFRHRRQLRSRYFKAPWDQR